MATTFQYIFDNAESISIDTQVNVAQTISRDNTVTALERGGQTFRFTVKMPDGISYEEWRPHLTAIDYAGKSSVAGGEFVNLNNSGYRDYMSKYQGDMTALTSWTGSIINARTLDNIAPIGNTATNGQYILKSGDYIQLKIVGGVTADKNIYRIVNDIQATAQDTATLHRAASEYGGSAVAVTFDVGPANVNWLVKMVQYPQHTIFARNQVSWSGPFVFYEVLR